MVTSCQSKCFLNLGRGVREGHLLPQEKSLRHVHLVLFVDSSFFGFPLGLNLAVVGAAYPAHLTPGNRCFHSIFAVAEGLTPVRTHRRRWAS